MTYKTKTPLALAIGTAFAATLATSSIANAAPSSSKGNLVHCFKFSMRACLVSATG